MNGLDQLAKVMQKAMQTTTDLADGMGVTVDEDILMKTFQYSPFLQVLEGKGRTQDVNTANVTFFREEPTNTASFIAEGTTLPQHGKTTYEKIPDRMKELVESISISELAQDGTDVTDLAEREITRAFLQIDEKQDYTLLNGTGTSSSNDFASILKDIPSDNKTNSNGAITEDIVDDILIQIIDNCGGHPDIAITDNFVAKQLKKIMAPYRRFNDKVDLGFGFRVSTIESPDGQEIPIVIDKHIPTSGTGGAEHKLAFVDTDSIEVKYLHRPAVKELPSITLSNEFVVRTHVTACNIAPYRNGLIEKITAPSS